MMFWFPYLVNDYLDIDRPEAEEEEEGCLEAAWATFGGKGSLEGEGRATHLQDNALVPTSIYQLI
jgi:hypothetical protein